MGLERLAGKLAGTAGRNMAGGAAGTVASAANNPGVAAAAGAAAYSGAQQVFGAAKNVSWLLVVFGFAHYLLRLYQGPQWYVLLFSLTLFVLSAYALAAKVQKDQFAIIFPMLAFGIWYFGFGANYDPLFLMVFLSIFFLITIILTLFTKGRSFSPEMLGFIPVLFLFLDLGLIPFLVEKMRWPITPLVESLVLYMPWWSLLGLLTLPSEATQNRSVNFIISFTKFMGLIYILFVIVAPAIPHVGYSTSSLIPEAGELEAAQQRFREGLPQGENQFFSTLHCVFIHGKYI